MSSARRRSRELALQGLYQWQYTGVTPSQVLKNLSELAGFEKADRKFLESELKGAIKEAATLREILEPLADRKWNEVSPIERSILLIGAWEILHCPDIPYRATINEAIELGKRFGGTDGYKYVNGVLDKLAKRARPDEAGRGDGPARGRNRTKG